MTRTLPLSEVKSKLSKLVHDVISKEDEIVITRNGRPAAVIINADEYEGWKETQEVKKDPELMQEIREGLKRLEQGGTVTKYTVHELFGPDAE